MKEYRPNQGMKNPSSILKEKDVCSIRKRMARGEPGAEIAREYGVTRACISLIFRGHTWKHLL